MNRFIRANDFAPTDACDIFCKRVGNIKSDGFAVVAGSSVLTIDGGREDDRGVLDFLLALRRRWLQGHPALMEDERVKLTVSMILTHGHKDHLPAVWQTVQHPLIEVEQVWYPPRAAMADQGTLPLLTFYENQYRTLQAKLPNAQFFELTFGEHRTIPFGNGTLELFAPPMDWSQGEGYAIICRENARFENREVTDSNGTLNNNSIWSKLTYQGQTVLFTGDQRDTPLALNGMIDHHGAEHFKCDVLKYIHHGAQRYSQYLADVAQAKIAVFTTPKEEIDPQAQISCAQYGDVYCTCRGDLILRLKDGTITPCGIEPLQKRSE